jgi:hypothetical protein
LASLEIASGAFDVPLARFVFMEITTPSETYTEININAETWTSSNASDTETWPDAPAASNNNWSDQSEGTETWTDAA